jgi:hypothetical protein
MLGRCNKTPPDSCRPIDKGIDGVSVISVATQFQSANENVQLRHAEPHSQDQGKTSNEAEVSERFKPYYERK